MRKLWLVLGLFTIAGLLPAQDFTATMTPEERAATGIDRLTPEELARLRAVVERYKSGEVAVVRQEAEQQVAVAKQEAATQVATVKQEAEQKIAVAETKAQAAESKAQAAPPAKKGPGWLAALVTLEKAGKKSDAEDIIRSRLVGTLKSFRGSRSFTLENGQVWTMSEGSSYAGPVLTSPELNISPGILGTFWLQIPDAALRVRVKPVKLE